MHWILHAQAPVIDTTNVECKSEVIKMDPNDDIPQLSADTLRLLQEFNQERDEQTKRFEELKNQSEDHFSNGDGKLSMHSFGEDWNASQFWYTEATARTLASQLLNDAGPCNAVAVLSAPSVYVELRNILAETEADRRPHLCLLEYDKRFEVLGSDFVHYDYQHPLRLPIALKGKFDRIICDPPFLSDDCQTKTALTVRYLAKRWRRPSESDSGLRMVSCTGERMQPLIAKLYGSIGVRATTFEPKHSKGLSNEFGCYANFECHHWQWANGESSPVLNA